MKKNKNGEELFDIEDFKKYYKDTPHYTQTPKSRIVTFKTNKISQTQMSRSKGYR